ncbi:hypothetical protein [Streptomyces varsoviensis]|nr:hypothetical protein [Streptomyces varsoviensis]
MTMDRVSELADLIRRLGPDGARAQVMAEVAAAAGYPSAVTTTKDAVMQQFGDAPDIEVEPA